MSMCEKYFKSKYEAFKRESLALLAQMNEETSAGHHTLTLSLSTLFWKLSYTNDLIVKMFVSLESSLVCISYAAVDKAVIALTLASEQRFPC